MSDFVKHRVMPNYPNYTITEFGNIINLTSGKTLKPFSRSPGVSSVNLYKDGKLKCIRLARTVYRMFVGSIHHSEDIVFIDGNVNNLHYTNLSKQPKPSLFKVGVIVNSKLTEQQVLEIRSSYNTVKELSDKFEMSQGAIRKILNHTSYKNIGSQLTLF